MQVPWQLLFAHQSSCPSKFRGTESGILLQEGVTTADGVIPPGYEIYCFTDRTELGCSAAAAPGLGKALQCRVGPTFSPPAMSCSSRGQMVPCFPLSLGGAFERQPPCVKCTQAEGRESTEYELGSYLPLLSCLLTALPKSAYTTQAAHGLQNDTPHAGECVLSESTSFRTIRPSKCIQNHFPTLNSQSQTNA